METFRYKANDTDATVVAYKSFLAALLMKLYPATPHKMAVQMAEETYAYEKRLALKFVPNDQLVSVEQTYHLTTIKELMKTSSIIDYHAFVQNMFKNVPGKASLFI